MESFLYRNLYYYSSLCADSLVCRCRFFLVCFSPLCRTGQNASGCTSATTTDPIAISRSRLHILFMHPWDPMGAWQAAHCSINDYVVVKFFFTAKFFSSYLQFTFGIRVRIRGWTIENKFSSDIMQAIITVITYAGTIIVVIDHRARHHCTPMTDNGLLGK